MASGVGTTTVSRVIRNEGPISDKTRQAVEEAIRTLGYEPNFLAGSLASVDSGLIGVVIPASRILIFLDLLHGIQVGLAGTRYKPIVVESGYDLQTEEDAIRSLLGWQPAAMLVTGGDHTPAAVDLLKGFSGRVIEMMDIDGDPIDTSVGYCSDAAGDLTARHLIARGYRKFAFIGHDMTTDYRGRRRFLAMSKVLAEHGLAFVTTHFHKDFSTVAMGRMATEQIRTLHPEVDVIVCVNDTVAMGGVFYCMSEGLRMPDDLAIFGFSAIEIGQQLPNPLSTIDSHRFDMGVAAVREILDHPERPGEPKRIDTGLTVIPGTTA